MKLIDQYTHTAEGYCPSLIAGKWQAAFLNYAPAEALEAITKLDIHHLTDEAFVLLRGHVTIIAAAIEDDNVTYETIDMVPDTIYNIPKETWHKVAMEEGSSLLIVEDSYTHVSDFEFYDLSPEQKEALAASVNGSKRGR